MAQKRRRSSGPQLPLPLIALGLILIVAAVLILVFQKNGTGGSPALVVDKQLIDYGDVRLDTELTFEIKVTNTGDAPLRFKEQPYIEVLEGC